MADKKSISKPAVEETPKRKPITSADELLERVSDIGIAGDHIKEWGGHLEEMAIMLHEAQDRGDCSTHMSLTAQGISALMSAMAGDLKEMSDYIHGLGRDALEKGEAK